MEDGDDDTPVKSVDDPKGEDNSSTNDENLVVTKDEDNKGLLSEDEDAALLSGDITEDKSLCHGESGEKQGASSQDEAQTADSGNNSVEELPEYMDEEEDESANIESVCIPADEKKEEESALEESVVSHVDDLAPSSEGQECQHTQLGEEGQLPLPSKDTENVHSSVEEEEMGEKEEEEEEEQQNSEDRQHAQKEEQHALEGKLFEPGDEGKRSPYSLENEPVSADVENLGHGSVEELKNDQRETFDDELYPSAQELKDSTLEDSECFFPDDEKSELLTSREEGESDKSVREERSLQSSHGEERSSEVSMREEEEENEVNFENSILSPSSPDSADSSTDSSSPSGSPQSPESKETSDVDVKLEEHAVSPCDQFDSSMDVDNALPHNLSEGVRSEMQEECVLPLPIEEEEEEDAFIENERFAQERSEECESSLLQSTLESSSLHDIGKDEEKVTSVENLVPSGELSQTDVHCKGKAKEDEHSSEHVLCLSEDEDTDENEKKDEEKEEVASLASRAESMSVCDEEEPFSPAGECNAHSSPKESSKEYRKNESDNVSMVIDSAEVCADQDTSKKMNGEVDIEKDDLLEAVPERDVQSHSKDKSGVKRKLLSSPQTVSSENTLSETVKGNIQYKGFKKRYIAQVSKEEAAAALEEQAEILNYSASEETDEVGEETPVTNVIIDPSQVIFSHQPLPDGTRSETPLTEYAQYLGLQPTVKFKCYKCGESGFPSMLRLQEHQNTCLTNVRIQSSDKPQPSVPPPPVEPVPSTNFRITRKVYLCSACGTYYENWNLFLHMREVHKRHICLFCLGMFSQADKLAVHLSLKHGITDNLFNSPEQFLDEYKSSFFVMCCTCEQMFTERDHFFDHACGNTAPVNVDQACSLCGLKGAHFPSCRRAFTDSGSLVTSQASQPVSTTNGNSENSQNSQHKVQEKSFAAGKYLMPTEKGTGRKGHKASGQDPGDHTGKRREGEDIYDISDAASYCHVNILEPDRQKGISKGKAATKSKGSENQETIYEISNSSDKQSNELGASVRVESDLEMNNLPDQSSEEGREGGQLAHPSSVSDSTGLPTCEENPNTTTNTVENKSNLLEGVQKSPHTNQSPKHDGESDSESSDSDGSSSSSGGSSEENEQDKKEQVVEKLVASDDTDGDKSDSDKMSIVVDESKSEDENEKPYNASGNQEANAISERQDLNESNDILGNENTEQTLQESPLVNNNDPVEEASDHIQVAGEDVPMLELTLEETLEALSVQTVVKECVKVSCSSCVYCNHAKKIAVNGKQLVLHLLAEHRFEVVVCSDSGDLTPVNGFVEKLKSKLLELQDMFFNTDTYDSADKSSIKPYDRTYECFHCHFITTLHKELYVHNRKMHQKTILLCIMCKSNFYSYSELLCHLCPGIYVPDSNILFRCCLCMVDGLPSAFRLMVHLRKKHHACDVCLETTGDQQKLSNHVWKHKLHHLCYRCGIAYRNKPDITKHLFWKHGTESVLCKKCLQKKWPHVYHFCIPPNAFLCEECNATFSRAVALKVHKRLHVGDTPYDCDECEEKFISKRLLRRHKEKHKQALNVKEESTLEDKDQSKQDHRNGEEEEEEGETSGQIEEATLKLEKESIQENNLKKVEDCSADNGPGTEAIPLETPVQQPMAEMSKNLDLNNKTEKKSKVLDVYDLPPLNLSSESDDSDDEPANKAPVSNSKAPEAEVTSVPLVSEPASDIEQQSEEMPNDEETQPVPVVDGVWDDFKTYKAKLEEREILQAQVSGTLKPGMSNAQPSCSTDNHSIVDIVMADHDYCGAPTKLPLEGDNLQEAEGPDVSSQGTLNNDISCAIDDKDAGGADHSYCFNTSSQAGEEQKQVLAEPLVEPSPLPEALSPPVPPANLLTPTVSSPLKKKQKSPKKKQQKQSGTSSSSDSSSNSDSSSCTCGTNCSCSSSSSSSSGSSSSSSDSDSSSSEGRRRQVARRERRRERAKKKLEASSKVGTPPPDGATALAGSEGGTSMIEEGNCKGPVSLSVDDTALPPPEPEETELLIHESDLDTTETETDEDFYDKYPQKQANKLLAEKRNQLLMLAAVAPVNNGTMAQPTPAAAPPTPEPGQKKKGKTKRHKKAQHNSSEKKAESKLKLNIPVSYYSSPSYSNTAHAASPVPHPPTPLPTHLSHTPHDSYQTVNTEPMSTAAAYQSTGSGSETESKRLSKRKRIPKRFYGDSSDEEAEQTPHQPYKWRKVTPATNNNLAAQAPVTPSSFGYRSSTIVTVPPEPVHIPILPRQEKSEEEEEGADDSDSDHDAKQSSSDSSNSDSDNEQSDADSDVETHETPAVTNTMASAGSIASQQKNENLYCYCQCPYDEVSEMIACDGKDCSIEWFHFECVGIMVPPKGKWFCPDCRKKTAVRSEYLLHA